MSSFSRLSLIPLLLLPALHARGEGDVNPKDLVKVSLVSEVSTARPGQEIPLALRFKIQPGWHIYWENPGDSGRATRATLSGPEGVTVSSLSFPGPKRFELAGDLINYGYEGDAALFMTAQLPETYAGDALDLKGEVKWLVCHDRCIPQSAEVSLHLPVAPAAEENAAVKADLAGFRAALPTPFKAEPSLSWAWQEGETLKIRGAEGAALTFYPGPSLPVGAGASKRLSGGRALLIAFPDGAEPAGIIGVEKGESVSYFRLVPSDVPKQ